MTKRPLFQPGGQNGFRALPADNLANLVVAAGVCKGLFAVPGQVVFGRILPGLGVSLLASLSFYAYQAYRLSVTRRCLRGAIVGGLLWGGVVASIIE